MRTRNCPKYLDLDIILVFIWENAFSKKLLLYSKLYRMMTIILLDLVFVFYNKSQSILAAVLKLLKNITENYHMFRKNLLAIFLIE